MPIYEYVCDECGHPFEALVFGAERPKCPECGSSKLEKQLSLFAVNDEQPPPPSGDCDSCPHAGGVGSCGMMD